MGWLQNADRRNQRRTEIDREQHRHGWVDSRAAIRSVGLKGIALGVIGVALVVAVLVDWLT